MYGHTYSSKSMDQPGKVASPARGQLNRKNEYLPVRVLRIWPRETGSAVPVRELELWENLKAEGTTRLGITGLADEAELVSLAVR